MLTVPFRLPHPSSSPPASGPWLCSPNSPSVAVAAGAISQSSRGGRGGSLLFSPCHRWETKAQKGHEECTGSYRR